jgi:hypothetical protein
VSGCNVSQVHLSGQESDSGPFLSKAHPYMTVSNASNIVGWRVPDMRMYLSIHGLVRFLIVLRLILSLEAVSTGFIFFP